MSLPTINIKGSEYTLVKDRVAYFNETFEQGAIQTELLSEPGTGTIVFKAVAIPDTTKPERFFVGHAQETVGDGYINETAALENAETSAVGRALGLMGIGVVESIASADELNKANNARKRPQRPTDKQMAWLDKLAFENDMDLKAFANKYINKSVETMADAKLLIETLKTEGVIDV